MSFCPPISSDCVSCTEAMTGNCAWVAVYNRNYSECDIDENILGRFTYYVSNGDADRCPPWSQRPAVLVSSISAWNIVMICVGIILLLGIALCVFFYKKYASNHRQQFWTVRNRSGSENVEMTPIIPEDNETPL